jgi:two-component system response regulator LytT
MTKIRTLIVDDEPHAMEIIRRYATHIPEIEIIGTCNNAIEAFQTIQSQAIDLLFLDIKMPKLLGTDLVRSLKSPPLIIFTTAYQEYAVEGFDLNAIDYLLKPIPLIRSCIFYMEKKIQSLYKKRSRLHRIISYT